MSAWPPKPATRAGCIPGRVGLRLRVHQVGRILDLGAVLVGLRDFDLLLRLFDFSPWRPYFAAARKFNPPTRQVDANQIYWGGTFTVGADNAVNASEVSMPCFVLFFTPIALVALALRF